MRHIVYIGTHLGVVGGIERFMQKSAELLRRNGLAVSYLYTGYPVREAERFSSAFDVTLPFKDGAHLCEQADLVIIHNIIPKKMLGQLPEKKTVFFAHDHNIYCRRHHYYMPLGRRNCHRKYTALRCFCCSLGCNEEPPIAEYRNLPALVLSDFMKENLYKNGFKIVLKLPAFIPLFEQERQFMPEGKLRIFYLGQLIRGKGVALLLYPLRFLKIPYHCTIAGDGKDRAMLENLTVKLHLSEHVEFTGWLSDTESEWSSSDVFFFPIRWQEPFGLVGLEAIAHGVPVVAFDRGGVREWLRDTKNGFAIPAGNQRLAAKALTRLQQSPELLKCMGKNAFEIARKDFSEDNFIRAITTLPEVLK